MIVKEVSTVSPNEYYSHIGCFVTNTGISQQDLQTIKSYRRYGNFRVSLVSQLPNDANCAYCQCSIKSF